MRGRAVVARRAHNPEVVGSSPAPATKKRPVFSGLFYFPALRFYFLSFYFYPLSGLILFLPEKNSYFCRLIIESMKIAAMVFAAGLGSRLYPLTADKPKALIEINGVTLLESAIRKITGSGISEIVVNVHHFGDRIIRFLKNHTFEADIHISHEKEKLLDTAGGLKQAAPFFKGCDHIVLYNVDILSSIHLGELIKKHTDSGVLASLAVRNRQTERYFIFDKESMLLCGWKNRKTGQVTQSVPTLAPVELAFSGIHIVKREIIDLIPANEPMSLAPLYVRLSEKHPIFGYLHQEDEWMDIGKYKEFMEKFGNGEALF